MRLAVLADAVGEGLQPPILGLADLAATGLDDALVLLDKRIHLLRADIRTRQEYVFIKRHCGPSFWHCATHVPARSPSSPVKGPIGDIEGGDTGRRVHETLHGHRAGNPTGKAIPSVQPPAGANASDPIREAGRKRKPGTLSQAEGVPLSPVLRAEQTPFAPRDDAFPPAGCYRSTGKDVSGPE